MKEKMTILVMAGVVIAVVVTMLAYASGMVSNGFGAGEGMMGFILIFIIIAAVWLVYDRMRNMRKGLPVKDERQTIVNYRAGYYSWIAAIWSAIGSMWVSIFLEERFGFPEITANYVVAAVVLCSAIVFFISYFYLGRKGE